MNKRILFVSHLQKQCGVHEFGKNVAEAIRQSTRYDVVYVECDGLPALHKAIEQQQPALIIYNYHPSTMPWITQKVVHTWYRSLIKDIQIPQAGILHEVMFVKAAAAT